MTTYPYPKARVLISLAIAPVALAGVVYFGYHSALQAAWTTALVGVAALFVLNQDRFKRFAFGWTGINAEVNEVLAQASATIDQLRALATSTARSSLTQSMAGMLGPRTMPISTRLRLDMKVIDELRRLEVTDAQMKEARERWDRGVGVLFGRKLDQLFSIESQARHQPDINPLDTSTHFVVARPILEARSVLLESIDFEGWVTPSAQVWRDLCARAQGDIPGSEALIEAYETFINTGKLNLPELLDPVA